MNIAETIEALPDDDYVTLVHHNGQAESSFPARDLKQAWATRLPGDPHPDDWMKDERVNTLP